MENTEMSPEDRRQSILKYLAGSGFAKMQDLIDLTGRSTMTVHRDVEQLAQHGLLRKFHGGVSAVATSNFDASAQVRTLEHVREKRAIALAARSMVEPGDSIMLDNSSTSLEVARALANVADLTVVTNYPEILHVFVPNSTVRIFVIGGEYNVRHEGMYGPPSLTGLDTFRTDIGFISVSAFDCEHTFQQDALSIELKQGMTLATSRPVLVADGSKFGKSSLRRGPDISNFTDLITTRGPDDQALASLRQRTNVHLVMATE